jgi:hypothetical protein
VRLGEEVGAAVEPHRAGVEHQRFEVDGRGIHLVPRCDVADVLRAQVHAAHVERAEGSAVDIGHVAVGDTQAIDLQIQG